MLGYFCQRVLGVVLWWCVASGKKGDSVPIQLRKPKNFQPRSVSPNPTWEELMPSIFFFFSLVIVLQIFCLEDGRCGWTLLVKWKGRWSWLGPICDYLRVFSHFSNSYYVYSVMELGPFCQKWLSWNQAEKENCHHTFWNSPRILSLDQTTWDEFYILCDFIFRYPEYCYICNCKVK